MGKLAKTLKLRFDDERTERLYRLNQAQKNRRFVLTASASTTPGLAALFAFALANSPALGMDPLGSYVGFLGFLIAGNLAFVALAWSNSKFYQRNDDVIRAALLFYCAAGSQTAFLYFYPTYYSTIVTSETSIYLTLFFFVLRLRRNVAVAFGLAYHGTVAVAFAKLGRPVTGGPFNFLEMTAFMSVAGIYAAHHFDRNARDFFRVDQQLGDEMAKSKALLLNVLPQSIATRLQANPGRTIADRFEAATVMFVDIVGFTAATQNAAPEFTVGRLNEVFKTFDAIVEGHGIEKIKTIGDAYMAVAGVPESMADHASRASLVALEILAAAGSLRFEDGRSLRVRIGLHSGPVVAGVIGQSKFIYDIWGPTVNLASRMESTGETDRIQMSVETARLLGNGFEVQPRGKVDCKGIGMVETCWLESERRSLKCA